MPNTTNSSWGGAAVSYDNTSSGLAATNVQGAIDEIDATVDVLTAQVTNKSNAINYHTVYPNGKLYNSANTRVTIPIYNPKNLALNVSNVYVYDSNGSFTDITSSIFSTTHTVNNISVDLTFNSAYAGKLLRIDIS